MRAVAYVTSAALDSAHRHPDVEARRRHQAFVVIAFGAPTEEAGERLLSKTETALRSVR